MSGRLLCIIDNGLITTHHEVEEKSALFNSIVSHLITLSSELGSSSILAFELTLGTMSLVNGFFSSPDERSLFVPDIYRLGVIKPIASSLSLARW